MSEENEYHYIPLVIPQKQEELVEDFDYMDEATDIVTEAFGDDLKRMDDVLRTELSHMLGCACLACQSMLTQHVQELYEQTRIPDEDTGEPIHSLLHQYILKQYGKL
ncbi:MAG: hypothetical protein NUV44_10860 [Candidatus Scalindua sp.]|nr:hypothetical protein [Candidatus Scalindua sp.]